MKSFFCRVMAFVFLFNCLTPTTGWGQTTRRSNAKPGALDKRVSAQVKKAQEANTPAAQFARADQEARQQHNARFAQADQAAQKEARDRAQNWDLAARDAFIQKPNSLYVAPHIVVPRTMNQSAKAADLFLKQVAANKVTFEELIEYADPMDPASQDLLTIAYAAEVIGNTVSEAMQLDSSLYDQNEFQAQLVQMQARLLYRMALLGFEAPSYTANNSKQPVSAARLALNGPASTQKTMAVASLRMALLKIHQFYQAKQLPDPADEYQKEMLAKKMANTPGTITRHQEVTHLPNQPRPNTQAQAQVRQNAAKAVQNHGNIASFMKQFVNEFKRIINEEPEQGSSAFQQAQMRAEYATAYALEYNPAYLKQIVAAVDPGPKKTDFKQDYAPIINAIFVTVFENTRYSTMGAAKTKQVLNLLQEFSDPQKYSLPTQVFALEAASLLYRPFNQDAFNRPQNNSPLAAVFAPVNFNLPDENLRRVFATRVANLYCPLVSTNSYKMKDYGLSSDEMAALADKLGDMYDGFYDIRTPFFEDADKPASQHVRANYPQTQCNITTHGNLNKLKKSNEQTAAFLYFSAEVLFWVYGGEVFSLLGTAFRLTRGAVAALPKAGRAFTVAARGEKVAAFNAKIQEGAKYANWIYKNKKQQGYIVEAVVEKTPARVEKQIVVENGVAQTVEHEIPAVTVSKPINHTYQLEGKYSHWNPKRWLGMKPGDAVVGYRVTRMEPGLQATVGEMRLGAPIDGLHNLQEVAQMTRQLQLADGSRMYFESQPYWRGMLNLAQAQQERWTLGGLQSAFKNQMDLWVPLEKTAQETGKISETTRWWNVTQWGAPAKWGELAEGQMWGKAGVGGTSDLMPVYVAPRTPLQFTWRGAANQVALRQDGIANISEVLPGFYTSGADLASGNVYNQMFNAYMKPLNWKSTAAKTFLPDYVPSKTFWQSVRTNPVLGAQLVPQLMWRNRFASTTAFFGAWIGADNLVYPPFRAWINDQAEKDYRKEMDKYGDTFSEHQAKMDELLLKEIGADMTDKREMTAYNDVLAAQPEEKEGTLVVAPILATRRALGMEFVDDASKVMLENQARKTDLNRAILRRTHSIVEQNKKVEAQNKASIKQLRQDLAQAEQQLLAQYPLGFAAVPGATKKVNKAYETYADQVIAARTDAQVETAKNKFNQALQPVLTQVTTYQDVLAEAEALIKEARQKYAQTPDFFTPKVEKQIRVLYKNYAQDLLKIDLSKPTEVQVQQAMAAQLKRDGAFQQLMLQMQQDHQTKHPEYYQAQPTSALPQYGAEFDPNAATE